MGVSSTQERVQAEPTETTGDMAESADRISKWLNSRKCLKHAAFVFLLHSGALIYILVYFV